ncbi:pyridoxamine 5'-phosphate oxidase family protein [Methanosphaerula palustris]|uniref:Pyridoxamine 5'-phosphate oxidase-related FMN-binding n=1 Tax=Methanosphaerula palustris (strain ATCC BAA-1556 / DSM 19958 / E1-9c) TaxID=521011 RepID=B8GHG0_METPE|nr:pyridoxamine 5'-phosphate oxidase family protein [Methanosphaerula palustris]ACL16565.1 pyridoxamine 5'-phosphate oxidase-related FMN-binding [Methanosphaerula palustris E1-9c]
MKDMRRKERQLTPEETDRLLQTGVFGVLSTVGSGGVPYGVPLHYVYHHKVIYFHCATDGLKLDLLDQNNRVSFCVVVDAVVLPERFSTRYSSVILSGRAFEVFDLEKRAGLVALLGKYSAGYLDQGTRYIEKAWERTKVYRIDIETCTGKGTITSKSSRD